MELDTIPIQVQTAPREEESSDLPVEEVASRPDDDKMAGDMPEDREPFEEIQVQMMRDKNMDEKERELGTSDSSSLSSAPESNSTPARRRTGSLFVPYK